MRTRSQTANLAKLERLQSATSATPTPSSTRDTKKKRVLIYVDGSYSFESISNSKKLFVSSSKRHRIQTIALEDGTFAQIYVETDMTDLIYNNTATLILNDPMYAGNENDPVSINLRKWIAREDCAQCGGSCDENEIYSDACDDKMKLNVDKMILGNAMVKRVDEDNDELGMTKLTFDYMFNSPYVKKMREFEVASNA